MTYPSLSRLLNDNGIFKKSASDDFESEIEKLQLKMLRIQQGIWHKKGRAVIVFEGFDAAGKGGVIRKLTRALDPRGIRVHPIGAPTIEEKDKHWLYRFWAKIPDAGTIAVFDRSWYGRVLVERVENLTDRESWRRAYSEINQFEKMLQDDGINLVKIFLAISKKEQLKRFEDRLNDPYKQWKLTADDLRSRKKWSSYVRAVDQMFEETSKKSARWHVIPSDHKPFARKESLLVVTSEFQHWQNWMEKQAMHVGKKKIKKSLKDLSKTKRDL